MDQEKNETGDISETSVPSLVSPGVEKAKLMFQSMTTWDRVLLFISVFIIAYAYGLDSLIRSTYQSYATSSYSAHSLLSTINILLGIISAVSQPTGAKIADIFGRIELLFVSVVLYSVGTIIQATSNGVESFATGAVIYQLGFSGVLILIEIIVADVSSTQSRVFFISVSYLPLIINAWVSGNITEAVLTATDWRWGIGMWAIIYPISAIPLFSVLLIVLHRAKSSASIKDIKPAFRMYGVKGLLELFDIVGIILLVAVMSLILTPLTIAGGSNSDWRTPQIIVPLVLGVLLIPAFIIWQKKAKHPLVPFHLLKDRGIWSGFSIAIFMVCAWYMQGNYLYTVLIVAFDFSIGDATRVSLLYHVCGTVVSLILSYGIFKLKRLRIFVIIGSILYIAAFVILIYFRGGSSYASQVGIIIGEVVLGLSGGFIPIPSEASVQAVSKHENMAVITGLYLASYQVGSALGNSISGAIWSNTLYPILEKNLGNSTLAESVYLSPFETVALYPVGTTEREAIINSYRQVQLYLTISGLCLVLPIVVFSFFLRNPKLSEKQSQEDEIEDKISA
ncbi:Siderophore transporter [Nowakowskiella sp. JEL0078]|nr:Siderophore transporter [Nowakowskiella sp. JEL0078]